MKAFFYFLLALVLGYIAPLLGLALGADTPKMVAFILVGNLLTAVMMMLYYEAVKFAESINYMPIQKDRNWAG